MLHNNWCIIKLVLTVDSGENDVIPVKTNYVVKNIVIIVI